MVARARDLRGVLDRLDQDIRSDVLAWGGQAQESYLGAKQQWDASMQAMVDHLQRAAAGVDEANEEYRRTDRVNAELFGGIPRA
jgi:WXG100 family type VII secretion target